MTTLWRFLPLNPKQEPTEAAVPGKHLRQTEGEDAVASLKPLLKEGSYRCYGSVPGPRLRQSLFPLCHEISPELIPPRTNLARPGIFAP
ncbi:hypothetical protein, partial [Acinetobacter sp. 226-4]|uniref:hypothetical protein n=1 Tax=Acinetobacter sp. 226-4 TaxID=2746719 RepID=UPI0025758995